MPQTRATLPARNWCPLFIVMLETALMRATVTLAAATNTHSAAAVDITTSSVSGCSEGHAAPAAFQKFVCNEH